MNTQNQSPYFFQTKLVEDFSVYITNTMGQVLVALVVAACVQLFF